MELLKGSINQWESHAPGRLMNYTDWRMLLLLPDGCGRVRVKYARGGLLVDALMGKSLQDSLKEQSDSLWLIRDSQNTLGSLPSASGRRLQKEIKVARSPDGVHLLMERLLHHSGRFPSSFLLCTVIETEKKKEKIMKGNPKRITRGGKRSSSLILSLLHPPRRSLSLQDLRTKRDLKMDFCSHFTRTKKGV